MANPIKPLRSVQKYFRLVGIDIDPPSETSSINWRNVSFFFCLIQHFVTVAAFFVFDASTVIEFGTSFFGLNMMFYCIPYFLTLLSQRHRMFELTDNFQQFMERRASSRPLYVKWNGNIERMCGNIYFAMVKISCVGFLLPLAATVVLYFMGDLTEESYALPTPAKMPFNWHTPVGFLLAMISEGVTIVTTQILVTAIVCFLGASCKMCVALLEDIKGDVSFLNVGRQLDQNLILVKQHFCIIVMLYSRVKQFVDDFNTIYRFITLGFFAWTLTTLCSSLLVLRNQLSENVSDPSELMPPFFELLWAFGMIAFFCEFSEQMITGFVKFNDEIYRCEWYVLPNQLQRMYLMFTLDTQQPKMIQGYGNISCTREAFKKTTNTGFSYFMTLSRVKA